MIRFVLAMFSSAIGLAAIVPLLLGALPFVIVKFGTRLLRKFTEPRGVPWKELIQFEPIIGWKPKANLNSFAIADRIFHLTTDSDGWRGKSTLAGSDIVVIGDSFAFGYGVDDKSFFGNVTSSIRIKTIGMNGYNLVQEVLWMERLASRLQGKLIVWFIYYGNDLYENLQPNLDKYRMPFVREDKVTGHWEIVTDHVSPHPWPSPNKRNYYARLAELCSPTFLSERAYSACRFLISRGQEICRRQGAELTVVTIPDISQIDPIRMVELKGLLPHSSEFDPDFPDRNIREVCQSMGIPMVAVKDHLGISDYKEGDCHWNERGHQKVAKLLFDLYGQHQKVNFSSSFSRPDTVPVVS